MAFSALPMLLMGGASILGGLLAALLPETLGSPLVETLEEAEQLGEGGKPFFAYWSTKRLAEETEKQAQRIAKLRASKAVTANNNVDV